MPGIRIIARALARAGKEAQLRNTLAAMLEPTRAEQGCKLYELYESNNIGLFYFYEEWENQDVLERHTTALHYQQLMQNLPDLLEGAFEVNILASLG
jgi:quinol monooxygenase YgiN